MNEVSRYRESRLKSLADMFEDDFVRCRICENYFKDPKILPCLHSYCLQCLSKHIMETVTATSSFSCPACALQITCPPSGPAGLKSNYFIQHLTEVVSANCTNPENCAVCSMQNVERLGLHKCIECSDCLCDQCAQVHTFTKYTSNHQVISLENLRSGSHDTDIRGRQQLTCSRHRTNGIDLYCMNCDDLICNSCANGAHKTHNCISPNQATNRFQSLIRTELDKLRKKIKDQNNFIEDMEVKSQHFTNNKIQVEEKIQSWAKEIHDLINQSEKELLQELNETYDSENNAFEGNKLEAETKLDTMLEGYEFAKKLLHFGKPDEIAQVGHEVSGRLDALTGLTFGYPLPITRLSFAPATEFDGYVKARLPDLLGTIDKQQIGHCKLMMQFSCRSRTDKVESLPTGVAANRKDEIIIADYANKKIKIFDSSGKFKTEFQSDLMPWAVRSMHNETDSILFSEDSPTNQSQFSTLDATLKNLSSRTVPYCLGVSTSPDHEFIMVTSTEPSKAGVYIFKPNMKLVGRVDLKMGSEKSLAYPWHIATKSNGDIVISDRDNRKLYIFSPSGELLYTQSTFAHDLCVDARDNIIVVEDDGARVSLLTPSCRPLRTLLSVKEGVRSARGICIDTSGHLVVTQSDGMVKVFRY